MQILKHTITHARAPIGSDTWQEKSDQWTVKILNASFDYFTGIGHRIEGKPTPPKIEDVLESLAQDARIAQDYDLDSFAKEFCQGMKVSQILETWRKIKANTANLSRIFDLEELFQWLEERESKKWK